MASPNERLLYGAKTDSVDMMQEVLSGPSDTFDVNYQDGLGNTALHYAASAPSPSALELLLETDGTDVDLQNRLDGYTPLHVAAKLQHEAARQGVIEMLLDAGADPRIPDRHGSLVVDYLNPDESATDAEIVQSINNAIAEYSLGGVDSADIAHDDDDGIDNADIASGSESD